MNPQSNKKADKAKDIAQAALDQFTLRGFGATSLEAIAAGAGIGKSTIYEYYANKEELFVAAFQEACDQWFVEITDITREVADPLDRLELIALSFMDCCDRPPRSSQRFYFEILMQTIMEGGVFYERRHLIRPVHQQFIRTIADILLDGISHGLLKPGIARDVEKIAINYLAFLDGMTLNALGASDYINIKDQIAFYMKHLAPIVRLEDKAPEPDGHSRNNVEPPRENEQISG